MEVLNNIFKKKIDFADKYKYETLGALGVLAVIKLLKVYFEGGVCRSQARLDGKTCIVTGSNTGIGKETALDLAKRGARVIIACRDVKKGLEAAEEIRKESGNGNVIVEALDLSSFESVQKFVEKIMKQEDRLDVLINNAGYISCNDDSFGVNDLGPFVLTNLLLDKLKKSTPSRIVNVSSYGQSKLSNVLFTRELAKRLAGTGVTTYALHPGVSSTDLFRYKKEKHILAKIVLFIFSPITWLILKTPKQAAQTSIYCAVDESLVDSTGRYYSDCKEKAMNFNATADQNAARLWRISEVLTQKFVLG